MRITELKASEIRKLPEFCQQYYNALVADQPEGYWVTVEHRGLLYRVGYWGDWMGDFFVIAVTTSIIFRGSLEHVKDMIKLCSDCHYAPHKLLVRCV